MFNCVQSPGVGKYGVLFRKVRCYLWGLTQGDGAGRNDLLRGEWVEFWLFLRGRAEPFEAQGKQAAPLRRKPGALGWPRSGLTALFCLLPTYGHKF